MITSKSCLPVLTILILTACASRPDPAFNELARFDHQLPEMQSKLVLAFDAYVVGIEKDNRSRVGEPAECVSDVGGDCLDIDAPFFAKRPALRDNLRAKYHHQHRPTFVSHIARFDGSDAPCFLVNHHDIARPCAPDAPSPVGETSVAQSFEALRRLGNDLDARLEAIKPSHVIIYTMGWNTRQLDAIDNFRRLLNQLMAAAREADDTAFRPLMIGFTWPSTGFPILNGSDYGIKAKDADEVGAIWQNLLINRELRRLKARHPFHLVVVGHSFGARLSSRAVFSAPLVGAPETPVVDLLIGLQGAYSFQRFVAADDCYALEGTEGVPYRDHERQAGLVALTSSRWDSAVTSAGHANYFVGSSQVFERTRADLYHNQFVHVIIGEDGRLPAKPSCDPRRVLMIDASAVIVGNERSTLGGAHSMIFTPQIGRLTYQLIRACASSV